MTNNLDLNEPNPNILCRDFPVLVTGGAGFMASWLVKYLLDDGYKIRVTVRDMHNEDRYRHLTKIAERSKGSLEIFEADLLDPDAFKGCMTGCNVVFHTASPYKITGIKNPQKELIDPSLEGTRNVLEAVNKAHSVKKVIFTSAISAIYGDATDIDGLEEESFNEAHWNKSSNLKYQPLGFAKTVAEREAWRIHDAQSRWKMATLNPSLCLGPSLTNYSQSGSFDFIRQLADGTFASGVPDLQHGLVDVRDVAHAHIFAAQDEYATGRFLLVNEVMSLLQLAKFLHKKFGEEFDFPRKELSSRMLYFFGFTKGFSRKYVMENVGKPLKIDNTRSRNELGVYYKPVEEAAEEMLRFILDYNMLK
ncbi:NAD-dependent epimerase/dehydratase family protein [Reichenbachiella agariperforans]|uniref:NAD-dependent epimerase/dehydratase family protein n=1 Tax=Reichenbachiella agariperforans TaxID=156994 RepID=UPI001C0A421C|nr:NAD-dependent epimerase/dehydratase family protein [Reichenbachiella agariperforans]MBU2915521.1 NAD-dependent epimerase/dehydratase family protein [Reichenbachiella agariperforans]